MHITPILAESFQSFRNYLSKHKLNPRHFAYVGSVWNLRGYRGLVVTVGHWWKNPKYRNQEFYDQLNQYVYSGLISVIQGTWESEDDYARLK
jgi:hypothetical protein